jgi:hypothetical protein
MNLPTSIPALHHRHSNCRTKIIQMLESTLHQPIYFTMEELEDQYSKPKLKVRT